ncbi:MAG: HNH endonuclease, partial [Marinifilaceae bacterium]|nr:HNH endonuclease [Marinifilaceae bacterium]
HNYYAGDAKVLVHNECAWAGIKQILVNSNNLELFDKFHDAVHALNIGSSERKLLFTGVADLGNNAPKFILDFIDSPSKLSKFAKEAGLVEAWLRLSSLGDGSKKWIRTNISLLIKISKEPLENQNKIISYYKRYNSNADMVFFPGESKTGQLYDEFGHPDFTNDVPIMDGGVRAIYKPKRGIKGSNRDLNDANNWALKSVNEGGGGFNASNFRRKGTKCEIKNQDGDWVECTWHHHQDGKTLIPVPSSIHSRSNAAHIGGVQVYREGIVGFFESPKFN